MTKIIIILQSDITTADYDDVCRRYQEYIFQLGRKIFAEFSRIQKISIKITSVMRVNILCKLLTVTYKDTNSISLSQFLKCLLIPNSR